jgi:uncharacterized protein YjbJ (UPF0337 family)
MLPLARPPPAQDPAVCTASRRGKIQMGSLHSQISLPGSEVGQRERGEQPAKRCCNDCRRTDDKGASTDLTDKEKTERTTGGVVGRLTGKAKEAAGTLVGNDDLAREGRLQQAQADAETQAARHAEDAEQRRQEADLAQARAETELERERLQNELATEKREDRIEHDRRQAEREAQAEAQRARAAAEQDREAQESAAMSAQREAERERVAAAKDEISLEQRARQADAIADALDPKEDR